MQFIGVVQADHEFAPGLCLVVVLVVVSARLVVIVLVAFYQLTHEVLHVVLQDIVQQIGSKRLLQFEDALHDMGHIDHLGTRVLHRSHGSAQCLAQLFRQVGMIVAYVGWHLLLFLQIVLQSCVDGVQIHAAVDERHVELILLQQCTDEVLRRDKLMPEGLAYGVHVVEGLIHALGIVDFHF